MAKRIKETPTIYGKDAERFYYNVTHPKKVDQATKDRMKASYEKFKAIATFDF